jgi:hypothetical protein
MYLKHSEILTAVRISRDELLKAAPETAVIAQLWEEWGDPDFPEILLHPREQTINSPKHGRSRRSHQRSSFMVKEDAR